MVIIIAVLCVVVIAAIVFGVIFMGKFKSNNSNDDANIMETDSEENSAGLEDTTAETKEVVWIENWGSEESTVSYTAPEGVALPYFIKVNRAANCVTVYGIDDNGEYTIPVKAIAVSCGREGNETIVGENYVTSDKYEWDYMVDGSYAQYVFRISGGYLFHSVPYYSMYKGDLEDGQFNKLGDYASLGCVRMCVADILWIYNNCPSGTLVTIYDDADNPGPLGKPETIKIPEDSVNAGWDPTDPDESNPWNAYSATISGAADMETTVGKSIDLLNNVTATDTCGNDITSKIEVIGKYTFDLEGTYDIKYKVTDAIGRSDEVTVKLTVKGN